MRFASLAFCGIASAALAVAAFAGRLPLGLGSAQMIGILCGAWNTWLTAARSLWNWPVGIASCLIFATIFGHAGLYGAMAMQLLYAFSSGLGWRWWLRGGERGGALLVSRASTGLLAYLCVAVAACAPLLTEFLSRIHDPAPVLDSLSTALNLCGQFLVMRKYVENWYFWTAADVLSSIMYFSQHLPAMGLLYLGHVGMCSYGLWQWRRAAGIIVACPSDPALI